MRRLACLLLGLAATAWCEENATRLSLRGVKAYQEAHFALAQSFFERAVREARLKGHADEAAMATSNWVDVLLEMGQSQKAGEALAALSPPNRPVASLVYWKRAQVALALGDGVQALAWLDSAESFDPPSAWKSRLQLDRLKARWTNGDTSGVAAQVLRNLPANGQALRPGYLALAADIAMAQSHFAAADSQFAAAIEGYRENHRYGRAAILLWKRAGCAAALGQRQQAVQLLRESLLVAGEIGLDPAQMGDVMSVFVSPQDTSAFAKRLQGRDFGTQDLGRPVANPSPLDAQNEAESRASAPAPLPAPP